MSSLFADWYTHGQHFHKTNYFLKTLYLNRIIVECVYIVHVIVQEHEHINTRTSSDQNDVIIKCAGRM